MVSLPAIPLIASGKSVGLALKTALYSPDVYKHANRRVNKRTRAFVRQPKINGWLTVKRSQNSHITEHDASMRRCHAVNQQGDESCQRNKLRKKM
jgi:hypothetical protein